MHEPITQRNQMARHRGAAELVAQAKSADHTGQSGGTLPLVDGPRAVHQLALSKLVNRSPRVAAHTKHARGPAAASSVLEEDLVQKTPAPPSVAQAFAAGAGDQPETAKPATANHTGLPAQLKSGAEQLSGISLHDVKVHYNSPKPAQLQAHAFAQGTQIHVAPNQEKHLPHEAWHVVQQKQGRVQPTIQTKGIALNDDRGLEHEADAMGAKALQRKAFPGVSPAQRSTTSQTVQAIMDVAAFQAATPASFGHKRGTIKTIDTALNNYLAGGGANKLAHVGLLIAAINTYLGAGAHHGARTAQATALRTEALAEQNLLAALGAPNGDLLDLVIARAGGAVHIPDLTLVANALPAAHKDLMPGLITAVGGAAQLVELEQLIQATIVAAPGNVVHLPALIPLAGGAAQFPALRQLITDAAANVHDLHTLIPKAGGGANALGALHTFLQAAPPAPLTTGGGATVRLLLMANVANGNWLTFNRLATLAPNFTQTAAPPMPGGLHLNRPNGGAPLPGPWVGANIRYANPQWGHFFRRHVMTYFDFTEIKAANSLWPAVFGPASMVAYFNSSLDQLAVLGTYLGVTVPVPATANVAALGPGAPTNVRLGVYNAPVHPGLPAIAQFFPLAGQAHINDFTANELRAVQAVVT